MIGVCFICADTKEILPKHKVCEDCHDSNRCLKCNPGGSVPDRRATGTVGGWN